ncbi:conserved unknown protein [Ectocarpus siliculosus]|uniref:Calpain catalytic domain-containing protein n=1 Tax=Ectocarpus siliculosus TaxID=2880 RepID=D8LU46_ECTSI|nr:conserved unknown protein [Ectocarpus siliculosus]|eukprot:CBN78088.1 conserved unknown protein [Ectocarpus siliculosus]
MARSLLQHISPLDTCTRTALFDMAVNYPPQERQTLQDKGVFWVDFASVVQYFRHVFLNWNPNTFRFRNLTHLRWPVEIGPKNDSFNLGDNPQLSLSVKSGATSAGSGESGSAAATVWVLLTRHVTVIESDPAEGDFLTMHVYADTQGKRVYYPENQCLGGFTPTTLTRSSGMTHTTKPLRINVPSRVQVPPGVPVLRRVLPYHRYRAITVRSAPCIPSVEPTPSTIGVDDQAVRPSRTTHSIRFDLPENTGSTDKWVDYTLVVSQYEKKREVRYSVDVYCTNTFRVVQTPTSPEHEQTVLGAWDQSSAGGALGTPFFYTNPQYALVLTQPETKVHVEVRAPKDFQINATVVSQGGMRVDSVSNEREAMATGSYRMGFCYAGGILPAGTYTVIFSTYKPGQVSLHRTVPSVDTPPRRNPRKRGTLPRGEARGQHHALPNHEGGWGGDRTAGPRRIQAACTCEVSGGFPSTPSVKRLPTSR